MLTQRTDHIDAIVAGLAALGDHALVLKGGLGKKARAAVSDAIAARPPDDGIVLVATGSYLGEGFDWPELDTLFLAFPLAFKGRVVQYVGRLLRTHAGKHHVELHDYVDARIPVLDRMHTKRLPAYATLGFDTPRGSARRKNRRIGPPVRLTRDERTAGFGVADMLPLMVVSGAALLRQARTNAGLSRRALAAKAGVPTSTVSRIEDEHSDPTLSTLDRLVERPVAVWSSRSPTATSRPTIAELATAVDRDARAAEDRLDPTSRLRRLGRTAPRRARRRHRGSAGAHRHPTRRNPRGIRRTARRRTRRRTPALDPRRRSASGAVVTTWDAADRAGRAASTPEPFRRRNLVLSRSALFRTAD